MADSSDPEGVIWAYDVDDEGNVGQKVEFFVFSRDGARQPELGFDSNGIVVDPDGTVSVARSDLGSITKISRFGELLREEPFSTVVSAVMETAVNIAWTDTCDFRVWVEDPTDLWNIKERVSATTGIVPQRMRLTPLRANHLRLDVLPEPPDAAAAA